MDAPLEAGLQRTNARLKRLIANLDGGVLVEDEHRRIDLVNQTFCEMFAIPESPEALIGMDCSGSAEQSKALFFQPEVFISRIDDLLEKKQVANGDILHMVDGRVLSRDYIPIFDDQTGQYIGHLWHYHDVTESITAQRRMERLLRFEEVNREIIRLFLQLENLDDAVNEVLAMTGHLLDVSRVYIFRFRENARILDNTHEWCAFGVTPEIENLQGLPFDMILPSFFPLIAENDLIAPTHISELPDDLQGMLEPQDIQSILWIPIYLGSRIEGFLGYDETRQPRAWLPEEITIARMIVESYARALEREQHARLLIQARDEAMRTAQLRAQFVANMSHEIRTPMTGTLGMLELLLETELDDLQQEFAQDALNSSSRLLTILNDILDFSKLDAGQVILEANPIDLKAIITEVKMTLMPQVKEAVSLDVQLDPQLPNKVYGDPTRIRQVLMNLVGNAVKFTHHGQVTIRAEVAEFMENVAYVRFNVKDTGVGISKEQLQHIFESFVQADGSTTRRYGGTGLGLSISQQLVELMGGRLIVESQPRHGSTFRFLLRLPIAEDAVTDHVQSADFTRLNVLLIDDNRTTQYVLAQQLESWGVTVHTVDHNAFSDLADSINFDLAFVRYPLQIPAALAKHMKTSSQVVYIQDPDQHPAEVAELCWIWPTNQSRLYNLLALAALNEQAPLPADDTGNSAIRGRVLLADDYSVNIDLVCQALKSVDVIVDAVANGQQVLDKLAENTYDLILMDIQMPVMDGVEATQQIRKSGAAYQDIPIVALTASVMQDEQKHYLAMGMNAVISKPFSVHHLREMVVNWLEDATFTVDAS